ncbi:MAG: acyltransferase, partial [Actinomycetales bacterium]|nr:acyltransferase [Actinomycetales bacterium]
EHTAAGRRVHLPEIDGIRGVALVLVVAFHLFGNGRVSGGVDVFLVISGFLVTRSVLDRAVRGAPHVLSRHYGRSLHRLVPSSLVVLAAVLVALVTIVPSTARTGAGLEILASLLYVENWALIASALSYDAAGDGASALQHYWSLAVQGQFLLVWPLVLLATVRIAQRLGRSPLVVALALATGTTVASFGYAVHLVSSAQPVAYLHTGARWWQLGIGGILALLIARWPVPECAKPALGTLGVALVVSCGFVMDGATLFPGPAALWPVAGALAVVAGAGALGPSPARALLALAPIRWLTSHAYEIYLWHWPLLVYYLHWRGYPAVGWRGAVATFAVTLVAAALTRRLVAVPALALHGRFDPRTAAFGALGVLAIVAVAAAGTIHHVTVTRPASVAAAAGFTPSLVEAAEDHPVIYAERGCLQQPGDGRHKGEVIVCRPLAGTPAPHAPTVVMSGGSHVAHWYPALADVAERSGWDLVLVEKTGCRLAVPGMDLELRDSCTDWNLAVVDAIDALDPDAVFTVGTRTVGPAKEPERVHEAQVARWHELDARGIPVLAIRDTPRFMKRVPECIEVSDGEHATCAK